MKKLTLILTLIMSFNLLADCRPKIEESLLKSVTSQKKIKKVGKISTGAAFVTVGGFYGYMGVVLLGPLWAGAIVGGTFGAVAALPVGTTFVIINQSVKHRVKKLGKMISILEGGEELKILHSELLPTFPDLTLEKLAQDVSALNESEALCDGSMVKIGRFAGPKALRRYLEAHP